MNSVLTFAIDLAKKSAEILLEYFYHMPYKTAYKADHSIVTEADIAVDRYIKQSINKEFPNDLLISEELHNNYSLSEENQTIWIVDPLDGTTNFSLGLHYWGVSLARLEKGFPCLSVQYFPVLGELYTAQKGGGAFLNDNPIHTANPNPEIKSTFFSCCSRTYKNYQIDIPYKTRIFGCATYSLCSLACGKALISFEAKAKIWDYAGAWLLIPEAGGCIEVFDHSEPFPLLPGKEFALQNDAIIATATPELMIKARKKIIPRD